MAKDVSGARDQKAIGQRLRWLIEAVGVKKSQFADRAGINRPTLSNYLSGRSRPSIELALHFVNEYEISLDWLYLGSSAGMPEALMNKIRTLEIKERQLKEPRGKVTALKKAVKP